MIQETSQEAYNNLSNELTQKEIIYRIIKKEGEINDRQLSNMSHLDINIVTARRNSLVKEGRIIEAWKGMDWNTMKRTIYLRINSSSGN